MFTLWQWSHNSSFNAFTVCMKHWLIKLWKAVRQRYMNVWYELNYSPVCNLGKLYQGWTWSILSTRFSLTKAEQWLQSAIIIILHFHSFLIHFFVHLDHEPLRNSHLIYVYMCCSSDPTMKDVESQYYHRSRITQTICTLPTQQWAKVTIPKKETIT